MSILGRIFGYDSDYTKDATLFKSEGVRAAVTAFNRSRGYLGELAWAPNDSNYLAMEIIRAQTLALKAVDTNGVHYHSNGEDFPDCDDFSDIARGQILKAAAAAGLGYAPAIFAASARRTDGSYHSLLLIVDKDGKIWFYETQNASWTSKATDIAFVQELHG